MTTDKRQKMEEFIWDEIESLWQSCLCDRPEERLMGVPPESLHIEQRSSGTLKDARCVGKVLRMFIRDDSGLHELQMPFPTYKTGSMRKAYWKRGYAAYFVNRTAGARLHVPDWSTLRAGMGPYLRRYVAGQPDSQ